MSEYITTIELTIEQDIKNMADLSIEGASRAAEYSVEEIEENVQDVQEATVKSVELAEEEEDE